MIDPSLRWLFDAAVILYALSILFYFIDFVQNNRKASRIAFWLLAVVWVLQTTFFILKMIEMGRFPVLSMFEGMYFYTWLLVTFSLVMNRLIRVAFAVLFTNIVGFCFLVLHLFSPQQYESAMLSEKLMSELAILHIAMAFIAYGAFTLAFVFSLLYVLQYKWLKKRQWGTKLQRLSDLSHLEKLSFVFTILGVPLLFLSLILGTFWASLTVAHFQWYDPKVVGSFLVLAVYSVLLFWKASGRLFGLSMAKWTFISFCVLVANFYLVGIFSRFHIWSA
nr:cytochrome c biogenesis protein CcsA [Aureibacillus halotolerans]